MRDFSKAWGVTDADVAVGGLREDIPDNYAQRCLDLAKQQTTAPIKFVGQNDLVAQSMKTKRPLTVQAEWEIVISERRFRANREAQRQWRADQQLDADLTFGKLVRNFGY